MFFLAQQEVVSVNIYIIATLRLDIVMSGKKFSFSFNNASIDISQAYRNVVPKFLRDLWDKEDKPEDELPEALSLKIADKEDTPSIEEFFQSRRKKEADPGNFVKPRPEDPVNDLSCSGHIALIEDHNDDITAVCFAFTHHVENMPGHHLDQKHTEIGTVLSCSKGLGLTAIAISALTLALREKEGEDYPIIAKVSKENKAANGLFGKSLGWEVTEQTDEIKALFKSSAGNTMRPDEPATPEVEQEIAESRNWYVFGAKAEEQAEELLYTLKNDGSIHTKSGKKVPFEFDVEDFNFNLDDPNAIPAEEWINKIDTDLNATGKKEVKRPLDTPPEDGHISDHGEEYIPQTDLETELHKIEAIIDDTNPGPLDDMINSQENGDEQYDEIYAIDEDALAESAARNIRDEEIALRRLHTDTFDM